MPTSPRRHWSRCSVAGGVVGVAMLVLAGCGSSTKTLSSTSTTAAPASNGGGGVTIQEQSVGQLGDVLVNQDGRTLYLLTSESSTNLTCTDANGCTAHWTPVALPTGTTAATAGMGADASKLGTVKSPSGDAWVTYNGWPLYTFSGDSASGSANGEGISGFGGTWEAVTTAGTGVAPSSPTPTTAGTPTTASTPTTVY